MLATTCCASCDNVVCKIAGTGTESGSGCVAGSVIEADAEYDGDALGRLASLVCCGVSGSSGSAVPIDGSMLPAPKDDWLAGPGRGLDMTSG